MSRSLSQADTINVTDTTGLEQCQLRRRLLNHWDNLDGSVVRGYAGRSLWKWWADKKIVLPSWETCINDMTPLGLHHLVKSGHHYGPDPGQDRASRPFWRNVYYHRADNQGLGVNRSSTGSNSVGQYNAPLNELYDDVETCPEKYLLWFHHVPWTHKMNSGRTLWEELQHLYAKGAADCEGPAPRSFPPTYETNLVFRA